MNKQMTNEFADILVDSVHEIIRIADKHNMDRDGTISTYAKILMATVNIRSYEKYELPIQTNADRIRSMGDEELTKILLCPYDTAGEPVDIMPCVTELGTQEPVSPEYCNRCMMNWLKREVEG